MPAARSPGIACDVCEESHIWRHRPFQVTGKQEDLGTLRLGSATQALATRMSDDVYWASAIDAALPPGKAASSCVGIFQRALRGTASAGNLNIMPFAGKD